jgi:pimeloyl-ACP methyl ester carboxylesterase
MFYTFLPLVAFLLVVAGLIVFGTRKDPAPMAGVGEAFAHLEGAEFPDLQSIVARDGAILHFRAYSAPSAARVALLIHGSASDNRTMLTVAQDLSARGVSAYAINVRGHGGTGAKGDIGYIGQLEDDLVDILNHLQRQHPGAGMTVVGHSAGGGLALRFAGGTNGDMANRYVAVAPFIHHAVSTTRKGVGGWVAPYVPRIVGLSILDFMHLRVFQYLPVIAYAVPVDAPGLTSHYSFRLQSNFRPHMDWKKDIVNIRRPTVVIVGEQDEMFVASAYAPLLEPLNKNIRIEVLPGLGHFDVYTDPSAMKAIADAVLA